MRAFRRVPEGLVCGLDDWERELLARLALEVRALLQADAPPTQGAGQPEASLSPRPESANRVHVGSPNADPVIAVLLPQASEDPVTAMEVSGLTRARLRSDKADRLERLAAELRAPSGPEDTVLVAPGQESDWLGATNDIRLVLAQRLGIESAQDAEHVHSVAFQEAPEEETSREQWYRGTALVYDMITWWQESLVSALFGGTGPA